MRPGTEMFLNADGRLTETGRYHVVRQAVPDGGSGDWEGPAADGRQFHGRHQQTIGPSVFPVAVGRGSVLLWRRSDTLCTSGEMDDAMFAHKTRLLDVAAQLKRSARAALGLAINCEQQCSFIKAV